MRIPFNIPLASAFLIFVAFGLIGSQSAFGQTTASDTVKSNIVGPLDFKGTVEELGKSIKGAIVTVYEDADGTRDQLKEIKKIVTPGNGEFQLKFEINKFYLITVEKAGYTTKGIDVDTDVRLARSQYTKVPPFEFKVDMVKDTDGLSFKKSVASVFYQIKRNAFDYELDYSKEEMEEEERLLREQEEKRRIAELAAQKKFELEEAAKLLREQEDASMEQKIKAAITVGNEDKAKTISTLTEIFPVSDTLRGKKAEVIYLEYQKERKKDGKTVAEIDYKALFGAAQQLEAEVVASAENEQAKKMEELRAIQEDAERKKEAAMAVQQQALELEMREKIAKANLQAEEERIKAEKEKNDKVYYAIFNANGDRKTAVANLVKTYPKGDAYAEQKAEAIYTEYEKMRLSGTTMAKMDFSKLFAAADQAEQTAVKEEIEREDAKERAKTEAYLAKEQAMKAEEERKAAETILQGLQAAPKDDASQKGVFIDYFPKNDPYRIQKGEAMHNEYVKQQQAQKKTGSIAAPMNFGAMFAAASEAETKAAEQAKIQTIKEKEEEQAKLEQMREEARLEKIRLGEQAAREAQQVHQAKMNEAKTKREKEIGQALEAGGGDRERTIQAILKTFPKGTENPELKAEAMYDAYVQESARLKKTGAVGAKLDFSVLFQAAEQAELLALQREHEEKQAREQERIVAYEEQRIEKVKEAATEMAVEAKTAMAQAEANYQEVVSKVEKESAQRVLEEQRLKEAQQQQLAMEQAKREALEREREEQLLAKLEAERKARLSQEEAEKERLAAAKLEEQRKAEALAKAEAERQLAQAEKERQLALEAQRKAEEERRKEEARLAAEAEKARVAAEQLAAKAEAERVAEQQRLAAEAEKARIAAEQAAAKAEEERNKEEQRLMAEAERARILAQEAAAKAEADRIKEEQRLAAEAEKARIAAEQAAAKAEEERKRQEEMAAAEEAKRKAEAEAKRIAEEKRLREEQLARHNADGAKAVAERRYADALAAYNRTLEIEPTNTTALQGVKTAETQMAIAAKAEAEKRELDERHAALLAQGDRELDSDELKAAKATFTAAAQLKPDDKATKDRLAEVKKREDELAAAEEERIQNERQYLMLMQEGGRAMGANNLAVAKLRYTEASRLKPDEQEPVVKLKQIADAEQELALQAEQKRQREEDAKRKFEEQQQQAKAAEMARLEAMAAADRAKAAEEEKDLSETEKRAKEFDRIKANVEKLNLNAEDQRKAFLSELSKLYPEGVTEELIEAKNYTVIRNVINESGIVTVYEQRTWDWGGVFWFKNGDISITESLYKLELARFKK